MGGNDGKQRKGDCRIEGATFSGNIGNERWDLIKSKASSWKLLKVNWIAQKVDRT